MEHGLRPVGEQIREWRSARRLSQMDLALDTGVSPRHLSFIETGRSNASREMIGRLAEQLEVPLRERNHLFLAAGYAPAHPERPIDDPELAAARQAIDLVLRGHEPFPALAVDRQWTLVAANRAVQPLLAAASAELQAPPVNVLRLSLHPQGLAPSILNLGEWKAHLLHRLRRQLAATNDGQLAALLAELTAYPAPDGDVDHSGLYIPLRLSTPAGVLNLLSTTTVFGTPLEVTLSELAIEAFFPADEATAARLGAVPSLTSS